MMRSISGGSQQWRLTESKAGGDAWLSSSPASFRKGPVSPGFGNVLGSPGTNSLLLVSEQARLSKEPWAGGRRCTGGLTPTGMVKEASPPGRPLLCAGCHARGEPGSQEAVPQPGAHCVISHLITPCIRCRILGHFPLGPRVSCC